MCTVASPASGSPRRPRADVTICLGGHPRPLVLRRDGDPVPVGRFGTVLGALPSPTLHETTTTLEPGDALLLYTDGVVEGRRDGDFFGEEAAVGTRRRAPRPGCAPRSPSEVAAAAVDHQGGTPADDIAVVVVRRSGFR